MRGGVGRSGGGGFWGSAASSAGGRRSNVRWRRREAGSAGLVPKLSRDAHGIHANFGPPPCLVAGAVKFAVVSPAERDREFIAHLAAKRPDLPEAAVVRIAGLSPTA